MHPTVLLKYPLASVWRRCWVRFFDMLLSSLFLLPLALTVSDWQIDQQLAAVILYVSSIVILIIYFLVVPWFWQGRTPGKKLFGVKLLHSTDQFKFKHLLARETIIIFIPYLIQLTLNLIFGIVYGLSLRHTFTSDTDKANVLLIIRIVGVFIILWYLVIICAIALDPNHQFYVDYHYKIYVTSTKPAIKKPALPEPEIISRDDQHAHLGHEQPGNISDEELKKIQDND